MVVRGGEGGREGKGRGSPEAVRVEEREIVVASQMSVVNPPPPCEGAR